MASRLSEQHDGLLAVAVSTLELRFSAGDFLKSAERAEVELQSAHWVAGQGGAVAGIDPLRRSAT
jgi:hypothetical protein